MADSMSNAVITRRIGKVARLSLNRPAKYNAFNRDMALSLQVALDQCAADDNIRAIYLTGEGKAFCSGQDLKEASEAEVASLERLLGEQLHPVVERLRRLEKPVVCGVNGMAAGAGASIALACDITVASASALFSQAFVKIGLIPDSGSTWLLPRLIGLQRAAAQMMLGENVSAEEAAAMGMIYRSFPDEGFDARALALAHKLAELPTRAIALTKMALNETSVHAFEEQLVLEMKLQAQAAATNDFREGIQAFLEKRQAAFTGK